MAYFSFLDHLNLIEDDSSRYEVGVSDDGFSYLDLVSEKKARKLSFAEKQQRETSAALDGSTRARGQSNIKQVETVDHDEVCFDTDLMAILRDIERRRQRLSVFPWAVAATVVFLMGWLFLVSTFDYAMLVGVVSAIFVLPIVAFALVNAWYFDRSRKDVHFAYKISGQGEAAFTRVNEAIRGVSQSGQALLLSGRRHFEDTRYSGGAQALPDFKTVRFSRGKPPLLDLEFDVWHLRAFNRDLYFMPDHVLIFDGAKAGGVNYANLELSTGTEVTQARDLAKPTTDARVVGNTYRFVNNDGSPDQRFNNNTEIPLIEYGVLNVGGAGLDLSLYVTNQKKAFDVPEELAAIRELAMKPIRKIAEQRRTEAAERRKARQDELFAIVLDGLSCVMFADGEAAASERAKILELMQRIRAPWDEHEIDRRMREFRNRAAENGLSVVLKGVCSRAATIQNPRQQEAFRKCPDAVVSADGEVQEKETAIRDRIVAALGAPS